MTADYDLIISDVNAKKIRGYKAHTCNDIASQKIDFIIISGCR